MAKKRATTGIPLSSEGRQLYSGMLDEIMVELGTHGIRGAAKDFRASINHEVSIDAPAEFRLTYDLPPDEEWSKEDVLACAHLAYTACTLSTILQNPSEELRLLCWTVFLDRQSRWAEIKHHKKLLGKAYGKSAKGKPKPGAINPVRELVKTAMRREGVHVQLKTMLSNWEKSPPEGLSVTCDKAGRYAFQSDEPDMLWKASSTALEKVFSEAKGG